MALEDAADQLADELGALAARLGALLGTDVELAVTARAGERAAHLVAEIRDGAHGDATAADVLALLWPDDPPLDWWRSPLGLLCAPTAARETDAPPWSRSEAAQVLGVEPGTVATMTHRGTLAKTSGGHVPRAAVLARLLRMAAR